VETSTRATLSLKLQYSDCHRGGLCPVANWLQTVSDSVVPALPRADNTHKNCWLIVVLKQRWYFVYRPTYL